MSKSAGNAVDPLDVDGRATAPTPLRFTLARGANPGTDVPIGETAVQAAPQLRHQAVERHPLRAGQRGHHGAAAAAEPTDADRLDPRAAARRSRAPGRRAAGGLPVRQGRRGALPLHLGRVLRLVPGAGQGRSCATTATARRHPGGARARARRRCCGCCTRSRRSSPRRSGRRSPAASRWSSRPWPAEAGAPVDTAAAARIAALQKLVTEVRRFRTEQGVPDVRRVAARLAGLDVAGVGARALVRSLARLDAPGDELHADRHPRGRAARRHRTSSSTLSGAIDVAAERARLGHDLAAAQKELDQPPTRSWATRSSSPRRPADVVDGIRGAGRPRPRPTSSGSRRGCGALPQLMSTARRHGRRRDPTPVEDRRRDLPRAWTRSGRWRHAGRRPATSPTRGRVRGVPRGRGRARQRWPETRIEPSLTASRALVDVLGDPQRGYPVVHVTGTNGKTSTARMIDALLREFGLRTGRFTSPHLQSATERISIDGEPISARALRRDLPTTSRRTSSWSTRASRVPLSQFEVLTAMGFAAFADAPVDAADRRGRPGRALGRHQRRRRAGSPWSPRSGWTTPSTWADTLGHRREKAGIIKPGAVAVLAAQEQGRRRGAAASGAPRSGAQVAREGAEFGVVDREVAVGGQRLIAAGPRRRVRRALPAAARRAPGAERGARAGRGRGVPRGRRRSRRSTSTSVRAAFAGVALARPAGGVPPAGADRAGRRRAQPARARALAAALTHGVPLHPADRGRRGDARQGRRGILAELEPVLDEIVVTDELLAAGDGPPTSWRAGRRRCSARTRVSVEPVLDDAIEQAGELAEEGGASPGRAWSSPARSSPRARPARCSARSRNDRAAAGGPDPPEGPAGCVRRGARCWKSIVVGARRCSCCPSSAAALSPVGVRAWSAGWRSLMLAAASGAAPAVGAGRRRWSCRSPPSPAGCSVPALALVGLIFAAVWAGILLWRATSGAATARPAPRPAGRPRGAPQVGVADARGARPPSRPSLRCAGDRTHPGPGQARRRRPQADRRGPRPDRAQGPATWSRSSCARWTASSPRSTTPSTTASRSSTSLVEFITSGRSSRPSSRARGRSRRSGSSPAPPTRSEGHPGHDPRRLRASRCSTTSCTARTARSRPRARSSSGSRTSEPGRSRRRAPDRPR